jgi:hypothetical protein
LDLGLSNVCGSTQLRIVDGPEFVSLDAINYLICVEPSIDDLGEYEIIIEGDIPSYPDGPSIMQPVVIVVEPCVITMFEPTNPFQDIEYSIDFPPITETIVPFTMEPNCGFEVVYTISEVTGSSSLRDLPSFMIFDEPDIFEIESNNAADDGEYVIQVTGTIDDGPQAGTTAAFRFTVLVNNLPQASFVNTPPRFVTDPAPLVTATQG